MTTNVRSFILKTVIHKLLQMDSPTLCQHVRSHGAEPGERLAACLADMRPLPRMRQHVLNQGTAIRKCITARFAGVWLLPRMRAHVLFPVA